MLDFYLTNSGTSGPPDESLYLGGLKLSEHESLSSFLKELEKRGIVLEFFEDRRLSASQVKIALTAMEEYSKNRNALGSQAAFQKLKEMFQRAESEGVGVRTVCD